MVNPVADVRIAGLTSKEQDDLTTMLVQWDGKRARNLHRSARYDGRHAARHLSTESTPPSMRHLGLVLGWPAATVDILNRRCNLEGFSDGGLGLGIGEVFDDNWLAVEAAQAGVSSLLHGTSFLVTTRGDAAAGEPAALITGRDALSGTGIWDGRSRRLRAFLSLNAFVDDLPTELTLYFPNLIITCVKHGLLWSVDRRPHPYGMPVEPLTYRARLGRPFGYSRISRPVMSLHDSALRTLLRSEVTSELYQLPQRVLLGADESAFIDANGNVKPKWQTILGAVWAIGSDEDGNRPDVKQLPGVSQSPYFEQLRMQAQLFAGETNIPVGLLGFVSGDANPTSAEAYGASREELIADAEGTTDGWSPAWRRSMLTALAIREGVNGVPDEWVGAVQPRWRSPAFVSKTAAADAGLKQLAAVPWLAETSVGLELLGLSDEQVRRAESERRRAQGRLARQAVAQRPSLDVQSLTAAKPPVEEAPGADTS